MASMRVIFMADEPGRKTGTGEPSIMTTGSERRKPGPLALALDRMVGCLRRGPCPAQEATDHPRRPLPMHVLSVLVLALLALGALTPPARAQQLSPEARTVLE